MTLVASIAAKNYLPRVRVLANSLREHHPELRLQVLLVDELAGELDPATEPYDLLPFARLGMTEQRQFCFRYDIKQRAAALKPYLLEHLLDQGHQHVLFLDPDMLVTAPLSPLLEASRQQAILLTPHLLQPASGPQAAERELEMLRAGQFNGGVIGVSNEPQGRAFLTWWQERLVQHAQNSVAEGMYYDQRWLDLAPALFERLGVLRNPGCNLAHWNLAEHPLNQKGEKFYCGNQLCRLVHFSGFDPLRPELLSGHAEWLDPRGNSTLLELMHSYSRRLLDAGHEQALGWHSSWEHFANGQPITAEMRSLYRRTTRAWPLEDPFACGPGSFLDWLSHHHPQDRH